MRRVVRGSAISFGVLALATVLLTVVANGFAGLWAGSDALRRWLCGVDAGLVGQVVPAVVVAIFVFAVGTAFVVAQVVPAARGTRAVAVLQGTRLNRTIAPTPALLIGSSYVVTDSPAKQEVAATVLVGALFYAGLSLYALISVLVDATDPTQFKFTLLGKADHASKRLGAALPKDPPLPADVDPELPENRPYWFEILRTPGEDRPGLADEQGATDDLYDMVRTVRGWVRLAARTNDSRELQEALEALLKLVKHHAELVASHGRRMRTVPSVYWDHATGPPEGLLNPLRRASSPDTTAIDTIWGPWAPPKLVERPAGQSAGEHLRTAAKDTFVSRTDSTGVALRAKLFPLPSTWFANEVGRAIVRATELGVEARSLVDRDTLRLLNTLENAAVLFAEARPEAESVPVEGEKPDYWPLEWGAGIMIRYLTEIGLGVRHAPIDRADWYLEPAIHLADLSQYFAAMTSHSLRSVSRLSAGAATGCLLVADAILALLNESQADLAQDQKPTLPAEETPAKSAPADTQDPAPAADDTARPAQHIEDTLRRQVEKLKSYDVDSVQLIDRMVKARAFVPGERLATNREFTGSSDDPARGRTDSRLARVGWKPPVVTVERDDEHQDPATAR